MAGFALHGWTRAEVNARPWMAGFCSTRTDSRTNQKHKKRPALGGPLSRIRWNLQLRAGPPTVGVIVRAVIVVASQHNASRGERGEVQADGGDGVHVPT